MQSNASNSHAAHACPQLKLSIFQKLRLQIQILSQADLVFFFNNDTFPEYLKPYVP